MIHTSRQQCIFVVAVFCAMIATEAAAEEPVYSFGPKTGWQAFVGPSLGAVVANDDNGFFAGGEVSITRLRERIWWGLYSDATHTFADASTLVTAGPTLGWSVVGIETGFAMRARDGVDTGLNIRGVLTLGFLGIYGRWVHLPGPDESFGQFGLYVKMPFWASKGR